jgi:hypothetical protein
MGQGGGRSAASALLILREILAMVCGDRLVGLERLTDS